MPADRRQRMGESGGSFGLFAAYPQAEKRKYGQADGGLLRTNSQAGHVERNHFPIAAKPSGNNHPLAFRPIKQAFSVKLCSEWFMSSSFHSADRRTYRKVMLVGLLFCAAFVVVSFFAREQPENAYVLIKADRLVRSAGSAVPAN